MYNIGKLAVRLISVSIVLIDMFSIGSICLNECSTKQTEIGTSLSYITFKRETAPPCRRIWLGYNYTKKVSRHGARDQPPGVEFICARDCVRAFYDADIRRPEREAFSKEIRKKSSKRDRYEKCDFVYKKG